MLNIGAQSLRLAMALTAVGISTSSAYAYLDPGTGSIILQVLLGGIAGIAVAGKLYWHRLLSLIGAGKKVKKNGQLGRGRGLERDVRSQQ